MISKVGKDSLKKKKEGDCLKNTTIGQGKNWGIYFKINDNDGYQYQLMGEKEEHNEENVILGNY